MVGYLISVELGPLDGNLSFMPLNPLVCCVDLRIFQQGKHGLRLPLLHGMMHREISRLAKFDGKAERLPGTANFWSLVRHWRSGTESLRMNIRPMVLGVTMGNGYEMFVAKVAVATMAEKATTLQITAVVMMSGQSSVSIAIKVDTRVIRAANALVFVGHWIHRKESISYCSCFDGLVLFSKTLHALKYRGVSNLKSREIK